MPSAELFKEAERQLVICNACRYCEGYCAVYPAMERRRSFARADLTYLANLCFDCRTCFYACQYAPPHEFAVNIPKILAELRTETYREYGWPRRLSGLYGRGLAGALVPSAVGVALVLLLVLLLRGPGVLLAVGAGEGAFYRVIPYEAMVVPALLLTVYGLAVFLIGTVRFWRDTGGRIGDLLDARAFIRATRDAFSLRYLGGGGDGCNYPDSGFSDARRWLHHLVFYGFLLDCASTTVAAIYDHFLGWRAPYPLLSWPVALGTIGGLMMVAGTLGLLSLKRRSDAVPAEPRMVSMDVAFLMALFLTSLTGLLLLALRETPAMGTLLAVHLGAVAALFVTLPYGKFAHLFYRYAALIRNSLEERAERTSASH
ncbi:MAG TPA: tricarballylate utilization 4Fe-4S protein TcuB [Methylomirabilota bacterium]|nr:tricarballylate utilization 4Fe-4S protein TcuB [Methylomirabilota bacterium]